MNELGAALIMLLLGGGLHGWGLLVRRAARLPAGTWPMTIAFGLAAWIAIGGVLNLARLAFGPALILLLLCGGGVALHALIAAWRGAGAAAEVPVIDRFYARIWLSLAGAIACFAFLTQIAPTVFNQHDDYQKYFAHVARMVQTGTLAGSPLNTLGSETLGGQAFLQGVFAGYLPFPYVNAADAVFCFGLTILLIGGAALRRPAIAPAALLSMVAVFLLEPQYVSVTALYAAAALVFAATALSADGREQPEGFPAPVLGLIHAALIALKTTLLLFVAMHLAALVLAELVATRRAAPAARLALSMTAWTALFAAPWVALHAPLYWAGLTAPIPALAEPPVPREEALNLLSLEPIFYGGSYALYTLIAAMPLLCGLVVIARRGWSSLDGVRLLAICIGIPAAYLIMLTVMAPQLAGYDTALRHVLPILIGAVPAILVLCGAVVPPRGGRNMGAILGAGLAALLLLGSVPDFLARMDMLLRSGSTLAYIRGWSAERTNLLLAATHDIFHGRRARQVAALQAQVPPGETLLVWSAAPFLLDFARNPIIDVDIGGLGNPWSRTPPVAYAIWQYGGYGVRGPELYANQMRGPGRRETAIAARGLAYAEGLDGLAQRSEVLVDTGDTLLLRIPRDAALPP